MENGKLATDPVQEPPGPLPGPVPGPTGGQPNDDMDDNVVSEAQPKMSLKEERLTDDPSAFVFLNGTGKIETEDGIQNGGSAEAEAGNQANGVNGGQEKAEEEVEEEVDSEGYRIEQRRETETVSHTEEIKEQKERMEVRTHEVKEVTLEEVRSKETTRPLSLEEFQAILDAEMDNKEEVEIGRDIVIEQYTRVESEHEQMSGGKVTVVTFSVKEEHTTEEIKEQMHFPGGNQESEFSDADVGVEKDGEVKEVEITRIDDGKTVVDSEETKMEPSEIKVAEETGERTQEEGAPASEVVAVAEESAAANAGDKGEKEKGPKSKGLINYIKVKARSLSRDRNRSYAVAAAAASQNAESQKKEQEQQKEKEKSEVKKGKQKKWKLFGKKSGKDGESSSDEGSSTDEKIDEPVDKSPERKGKFKLNLFGKNTDEQKEEEQVNDDVVVTSPLEAGGGEKPSKMKKKGKQKETQKKSPDESTPSKGVDGVEECDSPLEESKDVEQPERESTGKEQGEGGAVGKTKDHHVKWFHFGKKIEKDATDRTKETPEEEEGKEKEHKWNVFGKKTRKEESRRDVELKMETGSGEGAGASESEKQEGKEETVAVADVEHDVTSVEMAGNEDQKMNTERTETEAEKKSADQSTVKPGGGQSSENLAAAEAGAHPESAEDVQEKGTKEHKKFSFGLKFGKKGKKTSQDKHESKSVEDAETSKEKPEMVAEQPVEVDREGVVDESVEASQQVGTSALLTDEQCVSLTESNTLGSEKKDDEKIELLSDGTDEVTHGEGSEIIVEDQVLKNEAVEEVVSEDVFMSGQIPNLVSQVVRVENQLETEKEENIFEVQSRTDDKLLVSVSDEHNLIETTGKQNVEVEGIRVELGDQNLNKAAGNVEVTAVEETETVADAKEQTEEQKVALEVKASPADDVTGESNIGEAATEADVKQEQKHKKFTFGLKVGHKKEGKVDDDTQKHKGWSPFGKKPAKKSKEEVPTMEGEKEDLQKTPDSTEEMTPGRTSPDGGQKTPDGEKSASREGTLKKNKGLHKLFSFGKKTKHADDKPTSDVIPAAEVEGQTESIATDTKVEVGDSVVKGEKAVAETAEEHEKHHHKKFTFGLKFGKKHDKDGGMTSQVASAGESPKQETAADVGGSSELCATSEMQHQQVGVSSKAAEIIVVKENEAGGDRTEVDGETGMHAEIQQEIDDIIKSKKVIDIRDDEAEKTETAEREEQFQETGGSHTDDVIERETTIIASNAVHLEAGLITQEEIGRGANIVQPPVGFQTETEHLAAEDQLLVKERENDMDLLQDKPSLELEDVSRLVDDIMKGEISIHVDREKDSSEIQEVNPESLEISEGRQEEERKEVEEAIEMPVSTGAVQMSSETGIQESTIALQETEGQTPEEKTEAESGKVQKTKKPLFGIKFGKKSKENVAKEKENDIEQNGVAEDEGGVKDKESPGGAVENVVAAEENTKDGKIVEQLIIEVEVVDESRTEDQEQEAEEKSASTPHHHHIGIKWPHFGRKKKEEEEMENKKEEHEEPSNENETVLPNDGAEKDTSKTPSKSGTKKTSHGLGKGLLKIFSPKKQKNERADERRQQQESFVVYSIEGEGQVVAETHWRSKDESKEPEKQKQESLEQIHVTNGHSEEIITEKVSIQNDQVLESTPPTILNGTSQEPEVQLITSICSSSDVPQPTVESPGHFVVVAIDFGTTFSGYAFSFINDPDSIHMMRKWEGGDPGVVNQKTPTTILLTPDGTFHSFGFTARDFYHDLESSEAAKWMYFEKFKMALHHNSDLNKETMIVASNGKGFPAMKLFAYALRFFKDHALKELTSQSSVTIDNDDVRWVITVPAIWKAPAKQFMREAAYQASIASPLHPDHLLIALEPEAASIYVRKLKMSQLVPDRPAPLPSTPHKDASKTIASAPDDVQSSETTTDHVADHLKAGTRYMVVDCGGGTVDITVHELETDRGCLKELHKATGGPFGSTGVDHQFELLLHEIFGVDFIESFKQKRPAGWVDLMIAFESRKRAANPHKDNPLNVSLPFSFIDFYKKQFGGQVDSAIKKYGDKGVSWSLQGMLRLTPEAMHHLFQPTLGNIKTAISDVLNNSEVKGIEFLFLVGGFSESTMLQYELRKEFENRVQIIIPQDVSLTILKGAVCFGLDPTIVTVRKSRLTYGIGIVNRFDPSRHPESKRMQKDGVDYCTGIFDTFVTSGQSVTLGDKVVRRYAPANRDQTTSIIHVCCSESSDVQYVTDQGVQKCATLRLELADTDKGIEVTEPCPVRREIETTMAFGDTEISVAACCVQTGKSVDSTIDFLNK